MVLLFGCTRFNTGGPARYADHRSALQLQRRTFQDCELRNGDEIWYWILGMPLCTTSISRFHNEVQSLRTLRENFNVYFTRHNETPLQCIELTLQSNRQFAHCASLEEITPISFMLYICRSHLASKVEEGSGRGVCLQRRVQTVR